MEPLTRNGGFIGATLDFASEEQYITGTVAGSVTHFATTTGSSVNVTYPTGIQADDIIILAVAADDPDPNSYSDVNGVEFIRIYNDRRSGNGSVHGVRVTSGTGTYATPNSGYSMNWVCSVFRGVDPSQSLSSMLAGAADGRPGLPNPPSTGSVVPTDAMIVITAGLDDDDEADWTPAAPSGFTLSGYNGGTGNNATAMMAYAQGTGVVVDPALFTAATGSAGDDWDATTLVLDGGGSVIEYGNYKNSGVWDLQAVYDSLYVPDAGLSVSLTEFTATTSLSIPSGAAAGDTAVVCALASSGGLTTPPTGWTEQSSANNGVVEVTVLVKTLASGDLGTSITIASGGGSLGAIAIISGTGGTTPTLAGSSNIGGQSAASDITLLATSVANTVVIGAAYASTPPSFDGDSFDETVAVQSGVGTRVGYKVYSTAMASPFTVSAPDTGNYNSLSGISLEF